MVTAEGPLQDAPIHLHMTFPPTYPEAPPDVQLISDINAAFKIGDRLCIDMLRFSGYHGVRTVPCRSTRGQTREEGCVALITTCVSNVFSWNTREWHQTHAGQGDRATEFELLGPPSLIPLLAGCGDRALHRLECGLLGLLHPDAGQSSVAFLYFRLKRAQGLLKHVMGRPCLFSR